MATVAKVLFSTYLKQIFEDGFFHADPHPGNLFVTPIPATEDTRASWRLTFVDFGMVGNVPEKFAGWFARLLIGVGTAQSRTCGPILSNVGRFPSQRRCEVAGTGRDTTIRSFLGHVDERAAQRGSSRDGTIRHAVPRADV